MALRKPKVAESNVDLHIYVEPELLRAIKETAEENDRSFTAEVRRTLRKFYLENHKAA